MALFTVLNLTTSDYHVDGVRIPANLSVGVDYISPGIAALITAGKLSRSPTDTVNATGALIGITDASGGTPAAALEAIGGTYAQSEVANNFATVFAEMKKMAATIASLSNELDALRAVNNLR